MTEASPATGETSITTLLSEMKPSLNPEVFVFCTIPPDTAPPMGLSYQMIFRETEGTTIVISEASATTNNIDHTFKSRMITLTIHSSLAAVGFLAAITTGLAKAGIPVNPVSGYFHDHLFVPIGKEEDAMRVLEELSNTAKRELETESVEARKLRDMIDGLIKGQNGDWSGKT